MSNILKIGDKRTFNFSDKTYIIEEIIENPDIELDWVWNSGVCPHCKKKIERLVKHKFYRIEILRDISKKINEITENDLLFLGDTLDNRKMLIPKSHKITYDKILNNSKNFNKFCEVI